jgi:hypothetical protein
MVDACIYGSIPFASWEGVEFIFKDSTQIADNHGPHKLPKGEKEGKIKSKLGKKSSCED